MAIERLKVMPYKPERIGAAPEQAYMLLYAKREYSILCTIVFVHEVSMTLKTERKTTMWTQILPTTAVTPQKPDVGDPLACLQVSFFLWV